MWPGHSRNSLSAFYILASSIAVSELSLQNKTSALEQAIIPDIFIATVCKKNDEAHQGVWKMNCGYDASWEKLAPFSSLAKIYAATGEVLERGEGKATKSLSLYMTDIFKLITSKLGHISVPCYKFPGIARYST